MDREVQARLAPIGHLANLLAHDRIPLLLATYPQPWQVAADATPLPPIRDQYGIGQNKVHLNDRPFRKLEAFAGSTGIAFVNATSGIPAGPERRQACSSRATSTSPLAGMRCTRTCSPGTSSSIAAGQVAGRGRGWATTVAAAPLTRFDDLPVVVFNIAAPSIVT